MDQCLFCDRNRKHFLEKNGFDVSEMYFYEDQDFSISSDMSPLVTGHLLVIPTRHFSSFGEIVSADILNRIHDKLVRILGSNDLLLFEHGAVIDGQGGASIDHAHLHAMPKPKTMTIDFIDKYIVQSGHIASSKVPAPHEVLHEFCLEKQPYIYYELQNEKYAYPVGTIPHQFLRMMLQPYCQLSYNWRTTYQTEECKNNVKKTIEYVKSKQI